MKRILTISILFLTVSCSNISSNEQILKEIDFNKSEAIELHDELMAKMGELKSLKKQLNILVADSIENKNGEIELSVVKIEQADKSMWDWMHDFDIAYTNDNDSITLNYFEAKLESIRKVENLFDSAIYQSNQLIE